MNRRYKGLPAIKITQDSVRITLPDNDPVNPSMSVDISSCVHSYELVLDGPYDIPKFTVTMNVGDVEVDADVAMRVVGAMVDAGMMTISDTAESPQDNEETA